MNRADYTSLLKEIQSELNKPGGHFEALFGSDDETKKQAERIAAVALMTVDRYYARLTRMDFDIRTQDERHDNK